MKKVLLAGIGFGLLFLSVYVLIFELFFDKEIIFELFFLISLFFIVLFIQYQVKKKNKKTFATMSNLFKTGVFFSICLGVTISLGFFLYVCVINPSMAEKITDEIQQGTYSHAEDETTVIHKKEETSLFTHPLLYLLSGIYFAFLGCLFSVIGAAIFKNKTEEEEI